MLWSKLMLIYTKCLIVIHIIDITPDSINWKSFFSVIFNYINQPLATFIPPSTLMEAE